MGEGENARIDVQPELVAAGSQSDGVAALSAIYMAERADGNAIYSTSIQVFASMLIVAGVTATLLTTSFSQAHPKALLAVPVIAWGLASYTVIINALMTVRVLSIGEIERQMFQVVRRGAGIEFAQPMASDAGDWVSRVGRQTLLYALANFAAYTIALGAVAGTSVFVLFDTAGSVATLTTAMFAALYAGLFLLVVAGYGAIYGGRLEKQWRNTYVGVDDPATSPGAEEQTTA